MQFRPRRSLVQSIRWWWETRVQSWWTVRLPAVQARRRMLSREFEFEAVPLSIAEPESDAITAILTVYQRAEYLPAQIEALRAQTVPPAEIWVWCNQGTDIIPDVSSLVDRVIVSNTNWKFWGRFALGCMARTRYVSFFDDDIQPEPHWFENCLATYAGGTDGIFGGSGVVLPADGGYSSKHKIGWNGFHYDEPTEVDLVGHAWFFKKEYLNYLWREEPISWENGEDIHLSYMALKHGGLKTWVPPHPETQPLLWSCRPAFGKRAGRSTAATFKSDGHKDIRSHVVDQLRLDGWKVLAQRIKEN